MKKILSFLLLLLPTLGYPQMMERSYFGARLELQKGVMVGAGQTDITAFNEFSEVTSKTPVFFMAYINLNMSADTFAIHLNYIKEQLDSLPTGVLVQLGIAFSGRYSDKDVSNGVYDVNVGNLRDAIDSSGRRWYLRIGYEFNLSSLQYSPGYYRAAFRRVAGFFTGNPNVATVWSSAGGNGNTTWASTKTYYPGDDVVDWWGWNFFKGQYEGVKTFDRLKEFCDTAEGHLKPVMMAEIAPQGNTQQVPLGQKSWDNFFVPFFNLVDNLPQIKAFGYVNWNWPDHGDYDPVFNTWGDTRLQSNDLVKDSFNNRMADPNYIFIPATIKETPCLDDTCICVRCTIYVFNGNGNWDDANNWLNNTVPPDTLLDGCMIVIDPAEEGECVLNKPQSISAGAKLRVRAGKKLTILGDLIQL